MRKITARWARWLLVGTTAACGGGVGDDGAGSNDASGGAGLGGTGGTEAATGGATIFTGGNAGTGSAAGTGGIVVTGGTGGTIGTGGADVTGGTSATGGTPLGGFPAGGTTGGDGGHDASGGATGGEAGSVGTGGIVAGAGGSIAGTGGAAGGGAGCIDACELHGAPCCFAGGSCIDPGSSCVIDVLSTEVSIIYEYADLEQEIASIPQDVLVSFTDADIEWAAADPMPASRIEMHMTQQASSAHGATLEDAWLHPFRFSCDGEELFVGVVYDYGGAAGISTPVLHVLRDAEDLVVLRLGASQGAWMRFMEDALEARERIDRPELRAAFCQRGALRELRDATGEAGVACGDATCASDEFCCSDESSQSCEMAECTSIVRLGCDGPTDCPNQACCFGEFLVNARVATACADECDGLHPTRVCEDASDCNTGESCYAYACGALETGNATLGLCTATVPEFCESGS